MSKELLWLGQKECHNVNIVGAKAANCSKLFSRNTVPNGFCIPALSHPKKLQNTDDFIISPQLAHQIARAYEKLEEKVQTANPAVAVRSSALDEDSADSSFAGQLDTYLNIRGPQNLIAAVNKCWESAFKKNVLIYREESGLSSDDVKIAILIQHMVAADAASVAFSVNPVTGSNTEIIINANFGLGSSIVDGSVTPDTYTISKTTSKITMKVAKKESMTVLNNKDGTRNIAIPRFLKSKAALNEIQIKKTVQLTLDLEEKMQHAVDIECAYKGEELYLLQCRPVSTLKKK